MTTEEIEKAGGEDAVGFLAGDSDARGAGEEKQCTPHPGNNHRVR